MTARGAVDTLYQALVREIRARHPRLLTMPFDVAELLQTILPYRHHRRELGFASSDEYDLAMLELLSGAHGYLVVDDRMGDALRATLASPNPDPALVRDFAAAQLSLAPEPLIAAGHLDAPAAEGSPTPHGMTRAAGMVAIPGAPPQAPRDCPHCSQALPAGRTVTFCPFCGQDLTVRHCPACGAELEMGWRYCITCGRGITSG